jgi:hypothetical protein
MDDKLFALGRLLGFVGIAVCLGATLLRLFGMYTIGGFSLGALMQGGMATVVIACFLMLQKRPRSP